MLDQELGIFGICPQYDLDIMRQGQDLYDVTACVLLKMRDVLRRECPDMVLVHGDTTTTAAAALAAFYQQIPVGHVEAGLRTHNIYSPWPEEVNRQITSRIASLHFVPTRQCRDNLVDENVPSNNIYITGNTVIDALHLILGKHGITPGGERQGRRMVLITGHRRENFGSGMRNICMAIKTLAERYADVDFVYPMHPNRNVRDAIADVFGIVDDVARRMPNLHFVEPLGYADFVALMAKATVVLTDSGGIQEEAPGLGKPVLVMRDTTERQEAVEAGTVKLVGTGRARIVDEVSRLLDDSEAYKEMSKAVNPYGDGRASERIVDILRKIYYCNE